MYAWSSDERFVSGAPNVTLTHGRAPGTKLILIMNVHFHGIDTNADADMFFCVERRT